MGRKRSEPTETIRIKSRNASQLWSIAGQLQDKSGRKKTPDDALDYLFKYLFECNIQLELIKKKEKEIES